MKNILFTFDYELFLGKRSGTVENCLIIPTNFLLNILDKYNVKAVFFIDTSYLMRMEEESFKNKNIWFDFQKIKNQLKIISENGHYLFHHIHPHWLDAKYITSINQWDLENTNRFILLSINEHERDRLFKYSDRLLSEMLKKAKSVNVCNGYRAGGLFIEPFNCFMPLFEKYNIKYDFSVVSGNKRSGEKFNYDFSYCPKDRYYNFQNSLNEEMVEGKFKEFPISKILINGKHKIFNSIYYRSTKNRKKNSSFGDGLPVNNSINKDSAKKTLKDYFVFDIPISLELLNPSLLLLYKRKVLKCNYIHFLSHPKLLSEVNLNAFEKLLQFCSNNFEIEYDFMKFKF